MNSKGQNVIEYILLVVAVLLVCIFFLRKDGAIRYSIENSLNATMVGQIQFISNQIQFNNSP